MIIKLNNKLFREDPDVRFSLKTGLPKGTLNELWHKKQYHDFEREDLIEWLEVKRKFKISPKTLNRWELRMAIYLMSQRILKKRVYAINITYFKPHEKFVIAETGTKIYENSK